MRHSTLGLLRNANFPQPVMDNYVEDWKNELTNNFITASVLLSPSVSIHLASESDITEWELIFSCQLEGCPTCSCSLTLKFSKTEMKVVKFSTNSSSLKPKLLEFTKLKFDPNISILVYSSVMLGSLESSNSTTDLKQSFKAKIQNLSV